MVAGVAAVAGFGAEGGDELVVVEGAEEGGGGAEYFGGAACGVGGVVVIVEFVDGAGTARGHRPLLSKDASRGPGAVLAPGPRAFNTIYRLTVPAFLFRVSAWEGGGAGIAAA